MDDVLKAGLVRVPERIIWDEAAEAQAVKNEDDGSTGSRITAH